MKLQWPLLSFNFSTRAENRLISSLTIIFFLQGILIDTWLLKTRTGNNWLLYRKWRQKALARNSSDLLRNILLQVTLFKPLIMDQLLYYHILLLCSGLVFCSFANNLRILYEKYNTYQISGFKYVQTHALFSVDLFTVMRCFRTSSEWQRGCGSRHSSGCYKVRQISFNEQEAVGHVHSDTLFLYYMARHGSTLQPLGAFPQSLWNVNYHDLRLLHRRYGGGQFFDALL